MKRLSFYLLALLPLFCVSCFPTRIVTVSPDIYGTHSYAAPSYSTTITVPKTHTVTTTTQVYAKNYDISMHLDLQAVAAAFAQSSTIREFESLLNNASYIISNLDLNRDGYVDYLRVVETMEGYTHVFVIQAVIGMDMYQDVATLVVENPARPGYHVEIIGAPYIYGPGYIVRPKYVQMPYIFSHLCRRDYRAWRSPWYWNHYPSYYKHPAPIYLNHYQAYVHTFMHNHMYCHEVTYPSTCHYADYDRISRSLQRSDYSRQHPEEAFTVRNANTPVANSAVSRAENAQRQVNAKDIREAHDASKTVTTSSTGRGTSEQAASTSSRSSSNTSVSRSGSGSNTRSSSTSGSVSTSSSKTQSQASQTTVQSRVNSRGSSDTSIRTTNQSGQSSTVRRGSTSSSQTAPAARASSSSSSSSTRSPASSNSRGSSASSSSRSGSSTRRN